MTKQQFMRIVAKYPGVTVDDHEISGDLYLDAPDGKCFNANGCHCLAEPYANRGGQHWKPQAYQEMANRLSLGISDCHCGEMPGCGEHDELD